MADAPKGVVLVDYTWEQFDSDVERIARAVEGSGRTFTHVHGLTRGGLALAVCLSHRLSLEFAKINEFPGSFNFTSTKLRELETGIWVASIAKPEEVLIVDDLSDTGKQLQPYRDAGLFIATIHKKPWTKVVPDIWLREEMYWIIYPWEKKPR